MEIILDPKEPLEYETSAAIGNFDGIHQGHRSILNLLKESSKDKGTKSCVITFNPHPQEVLGKKDITLLYPLEERFLQLKNEGIDCVVCITFDKKLSKLSAKDFVSKILVGLLNIKDIIVGPDFTFGKNRLGNRDLLVSMSYRYGYETIMARHTIIDYKIVSSSLVRDLIVEGKLAKANRFLGYKYYIKGTVVEGEKRGRLLGFPTANIETNWELLPKEGVYATFTKYKGTLFKSITNIGYRPTFGENKFLIETHMIDFKDDIYNKNITIEFVERLRDEQRFENVDALVKQINKDVTDVVKILEKKSA